MSIERVNELREKLRAARESYYNLSGGLISDQEYDALLDELKKLAPNDEEVVIVGATVPQISVWEKVRHEIPMGSLNKANSEAELKEWAGKTGADIFHITHKIDGSSMELVYRDGALVRCVTRGDGHVGEDVTANISKVPSVPAVLPVKVDATVRGEIVMLKEIFQSRYADQYANPRNTAAAKVREKKGGGEACKDLTFLAYWIQVQDRPATMAYAASWLKNHGFQVPDGAAGPLDAVISNFAQARSDRESIPYEIDGMVVSVNNLQKLEALGSHGLRPMGQVAWKFDPATGITKVLDIKWQVGSSGRITPVMIVEPVQVGGVTITCVSLHNLAIFQSLRLWPGCEVLISRRNDVIPYCERNLSLEDT